VKHDIFQAVGLAAIVAGLFLLSILAGTIGLIAAGVILAASHTLEELNGSRTAPSAPDESHP
jgi:hypothetical protein